MQAFAESLANPGTLASIFAALAMFATITSVMLPALKGDKLEKMCIRDREIGVGRG